jgi:hypothetical protein
VHDKRYWVRVNSLKEILLVSENAGNKVKGLDLW